ncbi:probable single myb histone 4 at N-terminal half [Coccomyxa sp. Obi]|nr:probable single myb histone 4 at N-terminal half [Coccomyxa sp. Obi]
MSQVKRLGLSKQKWTEEEEQALRTGVEKFGVGKWRLIQKDETLGPQLINRSNVDLKDKWRNLNMDAFGSRGDKRGSRAKNRAKARQKPAAVPAPVLDTPEKEVLVNRQRKRKRRPERAPEANAPLPYRASSGALRTLQEVALRPDVDDPLPPRRRRRKPRALMDDDEDEEDGDAEPPADPRSRTGPIPDDMVVAAIISLQDPVGSHPEDIIRWIESHYEVAPSLKRAVRGTLRRMVEAGRLQSVPNHANLFRLGGVVRQVSQEAGINWPRSKPGSASLDSRTAVESAEAAAKAVAEAEEAAALATRLMAAADRYEQEAELANPSVAV